MTNDNDGLYIIRSDRGNIKLGMSRDASKRLSTLRGATPHKLTLIFFGVFGARAREIEQGAHRLLKPWRVSGEWFSADPFLAGIAIEAARDPCQRRLAFIDLHAAISAAKHDYKIESELDEKAEREFPDLDARLHLPQNKVIGLGRRVIVLPPTKYTRPIVDGFSEITWGAPAMPPNVAAGLALQREREERRRKREARAVHQ